MADFQFTQTGEQLQTIFNEAPTTKQTAEQNATDIQAEETARENADTALTNRIAAEETARAGADEALNTLISQLSASLANYYLKTETYNKTQVDEMVATITNTFASYYTKTESNTLLDTIRQSVTAETQARTSADNALQTLINNVTDSLINYYLKSETYSRTEVQQLISAVQRFSYVVAAELPTASAETCGVIYLIPSTNPKTKNVKDEFITISETSGTSTNYYWEQIGSTTVDLSGYYTSTQTDAAITDALNTALTSYYTKTQVDAALANYYTKTEMNTALSGKQNTLTFDDAPTAGSDNPVKSSGIKTALDGKQATLTFDDAPTENSNNPVKSGGVYSGIKAEETRAKAAEEANAKNIQALFSLYSACAGIMWRLSDTQKTIEYFGPTSIKNAIMDYIDNSPLPCEVKKDGTDFAYLTNTAGVASSTNWLTRADGTESKYATADKDYLQMVELKNINVRFVTDEASDIALVAFNLDTECPEGFHRLCKESTKLYARYDLTFNSDGTTLDSCNGTSQPSGTFSFNNVFSMTRATNTDLLNWTGWEIAVFGWLEAFRYNTFDLQSSDLGSGLSSGEESAVRNWINGTTDALTTPHGVSGGGFRFMYMENCNYGKQWLMGFGVRCDLTVGSFTYDEDKANAAVILATDDADETFVISATSGTYAKNVNVLGVLTESGGSSSTGFCDGNWSNIGETSFILYCGGDSNSGVIDGPFARSLNTSVSSASWIRRGRCAIKRSKVASA